MNISKLFKEEKPSKLIEESLKELMDKGKYEKREAFCTDKNINYETFSRVISNVDDIFNHLGIVTFRKSWLKKIITYIANEIEGLKSLIE